MGTEGKKNKRLSVLVGVIIGCVVFLVATGLPNLQPTPGEPVRELVVVIPEEPPHLFWGDWAGMLNAPVTANTYEALLARDAKTGHLVPSLATSWEQESETAWIFKLREGVTYTNGEKFDAETAAWSINYHANPDNEMLAYWTVEGMKAEVLDAYTIRVKMPKPEPILPRLISLIGMPPPAWALTDAALDGTEMVGTGPYILESWDHGESITLAANEDYWGGKPDVERVTFVWRTESAVRAAMLRAGEAQIAAWLAPQDAGPVPTFSVDIPETPFLYNDPNPPLDDLRVRKAACLALDREAIAKIFMGYATPANELVTSDVLGYTVGIPVMAYDPEGARALLAEAEADGVPVGKTITLYGRKGIYPNATEVMEAVQIWMADVGFNVKLQMLEVGGWREVNLDIPVPEDRVGITQSSHGNEVGDAIYTLKAYYGPYGPDKWYKYEGYGGGRRPVVDHEMVELIEAAIPLTEAQGREAALSAALAYHNENVLWACPQVHIQDLWGVSEAVSWLPRFDRRILISEASWN